MLKNKTFDIIRYRLQKFYQINGWTGVNSHSHSHSQVARLFQTFEGMFMSSRSKQESSDVSQVVWEFWELS